jgi:hypothetical protein
MVDSFVDLLVFVDFFCLDNFFDINSNTLYPVTPYVGSITPASGPTTGNTVVTVHGSTFSKDTDLSCFFDNDRGIS